MEFSTVEGFEPRHGHGIHEAPPQVIRDIHKKYQFMSKTEIENDANVVDFARGLSESQKLKIVPSGAVSGSVIRDVCKKYNEAERSYGLFLVPEISDTVPDLKVYDFKDFPGLQIYSGLLPPSTQIALVSRLLHIDLSFPSHVTNIHEDYNFDYPALPKHFKGGQSVTEQNNTNDEIKSQPAKVEPLHGSFFGTTQSSDAPTFIPKDPTKHKPLNMAQFFRKLRYLTTGAQYHWETRKYPKPEDVPSEFPPSIRNLVAGLFPAVRSESGVILLYSPKDFMPVHRDVSEESPNGIVSISLGCDGIFIIARENSSADQGYDFMVLRVRSGDVVHMAGESRFAWHAMSSVLSGTCPEWLKNWPVEEGSAGHGKVPNYKRWKGWMMSKRINISCRQVYQ